MEPVLPANALARKYGWDSHEQNNEITPLMCRRHDQPVAALLADLEQRGLLEGTLVFWGGEFGRAAGSRPRSQCHDASPAGLGS